MGLTVRRPALPFRRGILFSLISILVAAFILLLFWSANTPRLDSLSGFVDTRVSVMDQYLTSWDNYVADATRLSVRQSLLGMTERITAATPRLSAQQIQGNLSSCLRTGSASFALPGEAYCFPGGVNSSLFAKLQNFSALAEEQLGLQTRWELDGNITASDWAPFELRISFTLNSTVTDPAFAVWNRSKRYDIIVSVEGLPDPLFAYDDGNAMAPGFDSRNITQYPVPRDLLNESTFQELVTTRAYVENLGLAPTYLQRLAGNLTDPDPGNSSGIETMLIPAETTYYGGASAKNISYTANQLFAGVTDLRCGNETLGIAAFPYPDFRLDVEHLARYNFDASQLNYTCG